MGSFGETAEKRSERERKKESGTVHTHVWSSSRAEAGGCTGRGWETGETERGEHI